MQAGVPLVQFIGDRKGASECHQIVTLDHQWDSERDTKSYVDLLKRRLICSPAQKRMWCRLCWWDWGSPKPAAGKCRIWERRVYCRFSGRSMLCCTAWTGGDWDIRLGQRIDYSDIPCQPSASQPGYQCAAVRAFAVVSRVALNFGFGKYEIRPFFPNSASDKFLIEFGRIWQTPMQLHCVQLVT